MSSALERAGRLKADIRLAQAVSEFEADLTADQKASFRTQRSKCCKSPPSIHDVMRLTAEIDLATSGKGAGRCCYGPRLTNVLQAVQQFAALGDVVLFVNYSSSLDRLSNLLMVVGRSAPRYERLALLYSRSRILQSHLSEYFIVVFQLCRHLLKKSRASLLSQLVSSLTDSELKSYESDLSQWASAIKDEASLLTSENIVDQSTRVKSLLKFSDSEIHRQREVLKTGNATLFRRASEYSDWKTREASSTLMIKGKLGSGKSVLLANLVNDLNLHVSSAEIPVAYFFSRHDIFESLKARTIIGSLVRQLIRSVPFLEVPVETLVDETAPTTMDFNRIIEVLDLILPQRFKAYIVVDGLDECDDEERAELLSQVRILQRKFTLLFCTSSRPDTKITPLKPRETLTVEIPDDNPDIQQALLQGAQGMFLWVTLQIDSLCDAKTDEAIRAALADLPKDLTETFSRILRKAGGNPRDPLQVRIFKLVTAACRPLTAQELREALSVVPGDSVWNPARLLHSVYAALACCGSLITVDEEQLTVRLIHHSVKQFLLQSPDAGGFSMESANKLLGEVIVTYLNYGVFEAQLSRVVVPNVSVEATTSKIVESMAAPRQVRNLALKLLRLSSQPGSDHDVGKVLAEAGRYRSAASLERFHFYAYANEHWQNHISRVWEDNPVMSGMLAKLLQSASSPDIWLELEDCPLVSWAAKCGQLDVVRVLVAMGAELEAVGENGMTALDYAAENGHERITNLLVGYSAKIDPDRGVVRTVYPSPLLRAIQQGHQAIVGILLRAGANVEARDGMDRTALVCAIENERFTIAEMLVEHGAPLEERCGTDKRTALLSAAERGLDSMVTLILSQGVNTDSKDANGCTSLMLAAYKGHESVVRRLLDGGADINMCGDGLHPTPLLAAIRGGRLEVVRILLERGADVGGRGDGGMPPLFAAIMANHVCQVGIAELLLEQGTDPEQIIPNVKDDAKTPLSCAVDRFCSAGMIRALLRWGAKPGPCLNKAVLSGRTTIVEARIDHGADVNTNLASLYIAVAGGDKNMVSLLLRKGARAEPHVWNLARSRDQGIYDLLLNHFGADSEPGLG
ncbi:ankyrin repeat-containing domain protein [Cercophora newfieldiana]|uniref:Ankyrin repeat-containing domain protein n=1 Tax=Cercophora newfieldiana TaxID=92897 RepID=A0AA39YPV7_9PEZI|nr:ankyrin repeat-containing domain protein [Cercophora newfieldiana]